MHRGFIDGPGRAPVSAAGAGDLYLRLAALLETESLHQSRSIFNAETQIYRVQMSFDCAFANPQLARNFFYKNRLEIPEFIG
jgi:hypothetical protein